MAPIGTFNHDFVLANHHAMGVPMISNSNVTVEASFNVSQIVAISASERVIT